MATIASLTVGVYQGQLHLADRSIVIYRAPGVLEPGTVYGAWQSAADPIETKTAVGSSAAGVTLRDTYRLLVTTFVTVVDPTGATWTNCEVLKVNADLIFTVLGWYVIARWQLLPEAVAP